MIFFCFCILGFDFEIFCALFDCSSGLSRVIGNSKKRYSGSKKKYHTGQRKFLVLILLAHLGSGEKNVGRTLKSPGKKYWIKTLSGFPPPHFPRVYSLPPPTVPTARSGGRGGGPQRRGQCPCQSRPKHLCHRGEPWGGQAVSDEKKKKIDAIALGSNI